MSISELLGALHDRYGRCPSYQTVWRRAAECRIPSRRDERGRPSFNRADVPAIAAALGLVDPSTDAAA